VIAQAFHPFTAQHWIASALGCLAIFGFLVAGKAAGKKRQLASKLLAWINLTAVPLSVISWACTAAPKSLDNFIPLQLCDVATFTAGFALLTQRPLLCALTYFWGLAATLQALLTPAITVSFPDPVFVIFFVQHYAIVAAALYIPIINGWRPRRPLWQAPLEIYGWSLAYLVIAMTANRCLGTNFAFASHPPENPSLIDHLGPWPWYLLAMQAIAVGAFYLLTLPFIRRSDRA
jgi:hypothetical integral membrane protein (TIGR02206 family)